MLGLLLAAILLFASCVAIERNNPDDPGSPNYIEPSSSSVKVSSSSKPSSSSSIQTGIIEGDSVEYKGEIYKTVIIGGKTWMARNLNYKASGSSRCYNDQDNNCKTYGRLYDWNTAMTACSDGWRLPSGEDWNALIKFLNPSCSDYNDCNKAGTKLKATTGWDAASGIPPGTNIFGFTALPGGALYSDGNFDDLGECGNWWSSAEQSKNNAYGLFMCSFNEFVKWEYVGKSILFYSVRCVKD